MGIWLCWYWLCRWCCTSSIAHCIMLHCCEDLQWVVLFKPQKVCLSVFPISHHHCVLPLLFPKLCPTQQPIPYTLFVIVTAEHKPGISYTLPHMTCQISCLQQTFGIVKNDWYFLSHCSSWDLLCDVCNDIKLVMPVTPSPPARLMWLSVHLAPICPLLHMTCDQLLAADIYGLEL